MPCLRGHWKFSLLSLVFAKHFKMPAHSHQCLEWLGTDFLKQVLLTHGGFLCPMGIKGIQFFDPYCSLMKKCSKMDYFILSFIVLPKMDYSLETGFFFFKSSSTEYKLHLIKRLQFSVDSSVSFDRVDTHVTTVKIQALSAPQELGRMLKTTPVQRPVFPGVGGRDPEPGQRLTRAHLSSLSAPLVSFLWLVLLFSSLACLLNPVLPGDLPRSCPCHRLVFIQCYASPVPVKAVASTLPLLPRPWAVRPHILGSYI